MKDLTKKSGILYLAFFLFAVCAVATVIMAVVAQMTREPIEKRQSDIIAQGLRRVLPAFDNDPVAEKRPLTSSDGLELVLYPAKSSGKIVAYAVKAFTLNGYGGRIEGLVGFAPDGRILKYIVTSHNETPGIGTRVVDRVRVRTISDVMAGKASPDTLPPNRTLDSFEGRDGKGAKWTKNEIDFVSGATVSSTAATDLAWRAASALAAELKLLEAK